MQNTWPVSNKKFDEHVNDAAKHGLGVLDYTNGVLVDVTTLTKDTPFVAPFAGELVGVFEPDTLRTIAYAMINGNKTAYRSSKSTDYALNRDCYSIKLYKGDSLYFTSSVGGDDHYFYPYVNQKIVNLTGDDVVSSGTFNAHVNDTNLHYSGLPIGSVIWWSGLAANRPAGFLLLDGSTYDTTLYSELYAILGTNVLPNYIGRFIKGSTTAGVSEEAGLPNIEGRTIADDSEVSNNFADGAFYYGDDKGGAYTYSTTGTSYWMYFDASRSNSIYGKSNTVTPENISAVPLIKAKHYASVYAPASLDETLRTEHNTLKDMVAELQQTLASVRQTIIGFPDYSGTDENGYSVVITKFEEDQKDFTATKPGILFLSCSGVIKINTITIMTLQQEHVMTIPLDEDDTIEIGGGSLRAFVPYKITLY